MPESVSRARPDGGDVDGLLAALSDCARGWQEARSWEACLEALTPVEEEAVRVGQLALYDMCMLLGGHIRALSATAEAPDDALRGFLAAWPTLAGSWLECPGDPAITDWLIEFLRHDCWSEPLTVEDADTLRGLLCMEAGTDAGIESNDDNGPIITDDMFVDTRSDLFARRRSSKATSEAAPPSPPAPKTTEPLPSPTPGSVADDSEHPTPEHDQVAAELDEAMAGYDEVIAEHDETFAAQDETFAEHDETFAAQDDALAEHDETFAAQDDAFAEHDETFAAQDEAIAEHHEVIAGHHEAVPKEEDVVAACEGAERELLKMAEELAALGDDLAQATLTAEAEARGEEDAGPPLADDETTVAALSETAREMIQLLLAEAAQMQASLADALRVAGDGETSEDQRRESLEHFAEQIERFSGAVELLGLEGLLGVCRHYHENVLSVCRQACAVPETLGARLNSLGEAICAYLNDPMDATLAEGLVSTMDSGQWPLPLEQGLAAELTRLLAAPVVDVEDEESETRETAATPEDLSLALPGDVDPEVLDGLLQDLPGQTAEFSATVARLLSDGTLQDLEVAQRIAHTVKGAANTVGVAGIANLTHHVEDILLALTKHAVLPNRALGEALLAAADCLESMGEALLGQGAPPADALATLQRVLDWANKIDNEGIDAVSGDSAPPEREERDEPAAENDAAPASAQVAANALVRVPAPLLDDLLRLVGETIILTGQIQERLNLTMGEAQTMRDQYTLVQQLGLEMEELVDLQDLSAPRQRTVNGEEFDPLEFEQYNELHTCSRRLIEAATDSRELGRSVEEHLSALSDMMVDQSRLNRENREAVLNTRMVAVRTIVPRLQRALRQASHLAGKSVSLNCIGADTLIDSDVLAGMVDPLMHLVRNAVDHGIEDEAERGAQGKVRKGQVQLEFERDGNHILISCEDDGRGLDLQSIRSMALARGLVAADEEVSDEDLTQLVLRPAFSTRTATTQLSGRGIGLDVVNTRIVALGGSIHVSSETGKGCRVSMRLPVTLVSTHALLVRATSRQVAVSTRGITQILHPESGEESHLGDQHTYRLVDGVYPCTTLARLLGMPDVRRESRGESPVLLVHAENGLNAVIVDAVIDSRDVVVKSIDRYLPKVRGIAGATILGDGSVTPVLDLPELLREPARASGDVISAGGESGIDVGLPMALVVDDSLSARRSLAQFMSDSGFQVRTARDGLDAVRIMQGRTPDLLLVDLEMPRMNGLELTHHVRSNEETKNVPIIMITSRSTQKHRAQAESAGVTRYMTKPYVEDDLIEQIYAVCGNN